VVIMHWARGLIRQTSRILLDHTAEETTEQEIRSLLERSGQTSVTDLHVWQIAAGQYSAIIALSTESPMPPAHYKAQLSTLHQLSHITIEVNNSVAA
jgi:Co/Zn/Cd efflux system component